MSDEQAGAVIRGEVTPQVAAQLGARSRRRAPPAAHRAAAAAAPGRARGPAPRAGPGRRQGARPDGLLSPRPTAPSHRRPAARLAARHAARPQPEGDVLEGRQVREQQVVLKHDADAAMLGGHVRTVAGSSRTSSSSTTAPALERFSPARARSTVVLPAAFGPSRPTTSPLVHRESGVDRQAARAQRDRGLQAHVSPRGCPRRRAWDGEVERGGSMATEPVAAQRHDTASDTASITRLRAIAAPSRSAARHRRRAAWSACCPAGCRRT